MGPVAADSETVAVSAEMVVVRTLFGSPSRILLRSTPRRVRYGPGRPRPRLQTDLAGHI
jgi:hypothetical protein